VLRVARLFTGVTFAGAILAPILKSDMLKRTESDILEFSGELIQRGQYEAASKLLNSIALDERNFRWAVGRAIVELGRGDPRQMALEFAAKAIEQYGELVASRDPEIFLYRMAISFAVPEQHYLARLQRWLASESATDQEVWRLVYANCMATPVPAISEALWQASSTKFPLSSALLLADRLKLSEATEQLRSIEHSGEPNTLERLLTDYHLTRLQKGSLEDWAKAKTSDVADVTRGLRCEYQVRIALEWVDGLHRIARTAGFANAATYQTIRQSLIEQYETYPGLTNPDALVARVSAAAYVNRNVKRWPWLTGVMRGMSE
jgi:hypothetical protein